MSDADIALEATEMEAPMAATMHHIFAIKVLDKLPGLFKPHRYLYHCVRCKWSFVVNEGQRGTITPVDGDGNVLARDEALKRAATFALGPCPRLHALTVEPKAMQPSNGSGAGRIDSKHRSPLRVNSPLRNWAL